MNSLILSLFWSTCKDTLERKSVSKIIGHLSISNFTQKNIFNLVQKNAPHINSSDIKFYIDTENDQIEVYYLEQETEEKYNKRIYNAKEKDIRNFIKTLQNYDLAVKEKVAIKKVFDEVIAKNPNIINDNYSQLIKEFFAD